MTVGTAGPVGATTDSLPVNNIHSRRQPGLYDDTDWLYTFKMDAHHKPVKM